MGYSIIGSTFNKIKAETLYFVPLGENLEIWQLSVTNLSKKARYLSVFSPVLNFVYGMHKMIRQTFNATLAQVS